MADNPFILPMAAEAYVKPTTTTDIDKTIWTRYKTGTIKKLELSLKELKGRYGEDLMGTGEDVQAYETPRPSKNWRVDKDTLSEPLDSQRVIVMLKIGISKVAIGTVGKGENERSTTELSYTPKQAGVWLQEQIDLIDGLEKGTGAGEWFHEIAKTEAYPKSTPNLEGVKVATWEYNEEIDGYEAVDATPDEEEA